MTEKIAILHWCEGAGHAARNLAIASELESRGAKIAIAGGGPGKMFVELNGYEEPDLEVVEAIEKKTDPDINLLTFVRDFFFTEVPSYLRRFVDVYNWLKKEDPDKVITDDFFGVIAATLHRTKFYRVEHMTPEVLPPHIEYPLRIYDWYTGTVGEEVFLTSLWDVDDSRKGVVDVGPLAQEGGEDVESFDVLLIPGTMSTGFKELKDTLEQKGMEVKMVGSENWQLAPSMTPYTGAASCVVCTGFSSIADTVVAGTPCVVYPFFSIQERIADEIDQRNLGGLEKAGSQDEVIKAVEECLQNRKNAPEYKNGAKKAANHVLNT